MRRFGSRLFVYRSLLICTNAFQVTWKVGDTLVIASTDYDQNQAEVVNITQIVNPTTINFVPALKYGHHAGTYNGLEERAEVARLNRNIVIRGDAGSGTPLHFTD